MSKPTGNNIAPSNRQLFPKTPAGKMAAPQKRIFGRSIERDADDSSDDESVAKAVYGSVNAAGDRNYGYDLEECWANFPNKNIINKNVFIAHAVGIGLFYSDKVNNAYYKSEGLKEKYLSATLDQKMIEEVISKALMRTFNMFYSDGDVNTVQNLLLQNQDIKNFATKIISKLEEVKIDVTSDQLNIRSDEEEFFGLATKVIKNSLDQVGNFSAKKSLSDNFSTFYNRAYKAIIPYLVTEKIIEKNPTTSTKRESPYKIVNRQKDVNANLQDTAFFPKRCYTKVKSYFNGNQVKMFDGLLDGHEKEIAQAFFQDCSSSPELFARQIRQNLVEEFTLAVRKDLPDLFFSEKINDWVGLLSYLRLSNRAATSKMRKMDLTSQIGSDFYEDFFNIRAESSSTRMWNVGDSAVRESQKTDTTPSRSDLVFESDEAKGGAYPKLYDEYQKHCQRNKALDDEIFAKLIKRNLGIDDEKFDEAISSDKELSRFVAKVTYLLFGCETVRNPASLVENHMMLDLVIAGNTNWQALFKDRKMPMAPVGAVAGARGLHYDLKDYMPWPYKYEGNESDADKKSLIAGESEIIKAWLELKNISPEFLSEAIICYGQFWWDDVDLKAVLYGSEIDGSRKNPFQEMRKKAYNMQSISRGDCDLFIEIHDICDSSPDDDLNRLFRLALGARKLSLIDWFKDFEYGSNDNHQRNYHPDRDQEYDQIKTNSLQLISEISQKKDVNQLLKNSDVDVIDSNGNTALIWTAGFCNKELFGKILNVCSYRNASSIGDERDTALVWAVQNKWYKESLQLIDKMNPDSVSAGVSSDDKTALYIAVETWDEKYLPKIVNKFLNKGANAGLYDAGDNIDGKSPLLCYFNRVDEFLDIRSIKGSAQFNMIRSLYKKVVEMDSEEELSDWVNEYPVYVNNSELFEEWKQEVKATQKHHTNGVKSKVKAVGLSGLEAPQLQQNSSSVDQIMGVGTMSLNNNPPSSVAATSGNNVIDRSHIK